MSENRDRLDALASLLDGLGTSYERDEEVIQFKIEIPDDRPIPVAIRPTSVGLVATGLLGPVGKDTTSVLQAVDAWNARTFRPKVYLHDDPPLLLAGTILPPALDRDELISILTQLRDCAATFAAQTRALSPQALFQIGRAAYEAFQQTGSLDVLNTAIDAWRALLDLTPRRDPNWPRRASNLGTALQLRYRVARDRGDLDEAIRLHKEALEATERGDADWAMYASNLGDDLKYRYGMTKDRGDLDEAIRLYGEALEATERGSADWAMYATNLGAALQRRYEASGDRGDLDEAIRLHTDALEATGRGSANWAGRAN